jgi:hypothetical protein
MFRRNMGTTIRLLGHLGVPLEQLENEQLGAITG